MAVRIKSGDGLIVDGVGIDRGRWKLLIPRGYDINSEGVASRSLPEGDGLASANCRDMGTSGGEGIGIVSRKRRLDDRINGRRHSETGAVSIGERSSKATTRVGHESHSLRKTL